jgi:hypothetical protein
MYPEERDALGSEDDKYFGKQEIAKVTTIYSGTEGGML